MDQRGYNNYPQQSGGAGGGNCPRGSNDFAYHQPNGTPGRCYSNQNSAGNAPRPPYHHGGPRYSQPQGGGGGGGPPPHHMQQSPQGPQYPSQQQHHNIQQRLEQPHHPQGPMNSPQPSYAYISATPPSIPAFQRAPQTAQDHLSLQQQLQQSHHNIHQPPKQQQQQQQMIMSHPAPPKFNPTEGQHIVPNSMHLQMNRHPSNNPHQQHSHPNPHQHEGGHVQQHQQHNQHELGGNNQQLQNQQHQSDMSRRRPQHQLGNMPNSGAAEVSNQLTSSNAVAGASGRGEGRFASTGASAGTGYTLSPNAQVFVPASFMVPRDRQFSVGPSGNDRIQTYRQRQHETNEDFYSSNCDLSSSYDEEDDALLQLQMFITDVTLTPAMFETRVYDLAEVIYEELKKSPSTVPDIVATIFQAGVLQQNFRYSGARLCDYLSELVVVQGQHLIRDHILQHAYQTVSANRTVFGDKERDKESRGVVLFCAELLSQLDLGYGLSMAHSYPDMGHKLVGIISELIRSSDKDNQKNAIQALKLCGGNLEKLCEGSPTMDILLAECGAVEAREGVDATIKAMLQRLPQLRQQNWGYVSKARNEPSTYAFGQHAQADHSQLPVMYGPDGQPLSSEEIGFLDGGNDASAGDCPSDLSQSTSAGMDDEALEAYEQFLQETGQK